MAEQLTDPDEDVLDQDRIDAVLRAVEAGDSAAIDALLDPLHAADIADLLEQIGGTDRRALLRLWSHEIDGDILPKSRKRSGKR
ncbi:MAG: hypothetical protein HC783_13455 [Rhodobacteraceae bacterium]|nr:hypothetical protein [Paracoccaceae bacterium]